MTILNILKDHGPILSSRVVDVLVSESHLSRETARQRVSRVREPVLKVEGLNLPNREKFLYVRDQFASPEFLDSLATTLKDKRTSAGRALQGLEARGGAIPDLLFPTISATFIKKTKGQLFFSKVRSQLIDNRLISFVPDAIYGGVLCNYQHNGLSNRQRACLEVEAILLSIIRNWVTGIGLGSYNATRVRGVEPPNFGPFSFDLVGPSYIQGLSEYANGKRQPGFIVADILLDKEVSRSDVSPFLFKIDHLNSQHTRPFVAMFIADGFTNEAFKVLRAKGILLARPSVVLGEEVAQLLKELLRILENAAEELMKSPDNAFELLRRLAKLEGSSLNVRSVILDFILARLYALEGYRVNIRQNIRSQSGEPAEIDVIAERSDEVVCIECKAVSPGNRVFREDLEGWLERPLPRIKSWLKNHDGLPAKKRFEFCTSGLFDADAQDLIRQVLAQHKKEPIAFSSGTDILKRLGKLNQHSLIRVFREHFVSS